MKEKKEKRMDKVKKILQRENTKNILILFIVSKIGRAHV